MLRYIVICLFVALATGGCEHQLYHFDYELRVPATVRVHPHSDFEVVSMYNAEGTPVQLAMHRQEDRFVIYANGCLMTEGQGPYAVTVELRDRPAQVFRLPFGSRPNACDWTAWKKPDYVETPRAHEAAWMSFMDGLGASRSDEIPPDAFELRYKLRLYPRW